MITNCGRNTLGSSGRTTTSCAVGSVSFPGAGSSTRIAKFNLANPQPQVSPSLGSTPYAQNSNGGYGGGGGGGAPQYKRNKPGNGYSGGQGGNGLVCLYANTSQINDTDYSGITVSPIPPVPNINNNPVPTLNVISATGTIAYDNSSYPNNQGKSLGGISYNGQTYFSIFLGPGTFEIETNLPIIYIAMTGGGGGGAGGCSLYSYESFLGSGGGGGSAVISGTLYLYQCGSDNFTGLTSTMVITVGSGGSGGQGGSPSSVLGTAGKTGTQSTVSITNSLFSTPIVLTTGAGSGGNPPCTNNPSYNNSYPSCIGGGGNQGTFTYSGLSQNGLNSLDMFSGGNGGSGSGIIGVESVLPGGNGGSITQIPSPQPPPKYPQQAFEIPYFNNGNSSTPVNLGGGGGGSNALSPTETTRAQLTGSFGGAGAGGNGGSINNKAPGSQSLSVWSIIQSVFTVLSDLDTFADILKLAFVTA